MQPKYDALYRALVTANTDSTNSGKIRVQCPQIAGLAEVRSAEPANPGMPVPSIGTTVWLAFSGGDITKPTYFTNTVWNSNYLIQDWTAFTLASGFTGNGNNNGTPQFQVVREYGATKVYLRGGINITYPGGSIPSSGVWANIPTLAIPTSRASLLGACSGTSSTTYSLKMDFNIDGTAAIVGTNTSTIQPPWVSINGLSYYV